MMLVKVLLHESSYHAQLNFYDSVVRKTASDRNTSAQLVAGGDSLLFMVVAKHTADDCPAGPARRDMDFVAKVAEHLELFGHSATVEKAERS
jgi:hypothetical protein